MVEIHPFLPILAIAMVGTIGIAVVGWRNRSRPSARFEIRGVTPGRISGGDRGDGSGSVSSAGS